MILSEANSTTALGLSARKISSLVGYSSLYEFEDFIRYVSAKKLDEIKPEVQKSIETSRRAFKFSKSFIRSKKLRDLLCRNLIPKSSRVHLDNDTFLFLPTFNHPFELFSLQAIENWRKRCRHAVCYINEVWETELKSCSYLIELLKDFDYIFIGLNHSVDLLQEMTGRPCAYLPVGVDALRFCAYNKSQITRDIDVCNIGRRSDVTHSALMDLANQEDIFYYYDTISPGRDVKNASKQVTFNVKCHQEHRLLLANLLKRSRYFIANRAFANDQSRTGKHHEIPARFFEGTASGTVILGDPPATQIFNDYFDWEDAIIQIPFDAPNIAEVIAELDAQPERLANIRKRNTIHALLRHDWLCRLEAIYSILDLPPSQEMMQRSRRISDLVDHIHQLP